MKKTYSIVGMEHQGTEQFVASLRPGLALKLVREPDNKFDKKAVAVWCGDRKIGYLPGKTNASISAKIDKDGEPHVFISANIVTDEKPKTATEVAASEASPVMAMDATFTRSANSGYPQIVVEE